MHDEWQSGERHDLSEGSMAQRKPTSDTGGIAAIDYYSAGHCPRRAVATSLIVQLIGHIAHHVNIHDRAGATATLLSFVKQ